MTVIVRQNDNQVSSLKFNTPIAEKGSASVKIYSNTLYPLTFDMDTSPAKAFYFDIGGSGSVQTKSGDDSFKNVFQSITPTIAENGASARVVGWLYDPDTTTLYFVTFYNSPSNGIEYAIHEYNTSTHAISSVSIFTDATPASTEIPPNPNCLFEVGGTMYLAYNTGADGVVASYASGVVTTVTTFSAGVADYETLRIRNIAKAGDHIIVSGTVIDDGGTYENKSFIYVRDAATMPATVSVAATASYLFLSTDVFGAAACNIESACGKDSVDEIGEIHGAIFGRYTAGITTYRFGASFRYHATDHDIVFSSLVILDSTAFGIPAQCAMVERQISDYIFLSDRYAADTRNFTALRFVPCGNCGSVADGIIYTKKAQDASIVEEATPGQKFSVSVSVNNTDTSSIQLLNFYLGDHSSPGTNVARLALNAGTIEFYIADDGGTLRLAASATPSAYVGAKVEETTISRDEYGAWSISHDGVDLAVTEGAGSALPFSPGNYVELHGSTLGMSYTDLTVIVSDDTMMTGIPGSQMVESGENFNITEKRIVIELGQDYRVSGTADRAAFDVIDNGDADIRIYLAGAQSSESVIRRFDYDMSVGVVSQSTEGGAFGVSGLGQAILAPVVSEDDEALYPIVAAPIALGSPTPDMLFLLSRCDLDLSFSINEADADIEFDTAHGSIVAGTAQSDNLVFSDPLSAWSSQNFPVYGYPYSPLALIDPAYPFVVCGEGYADFVRKKASPTSAYATIYHLWRGESGVTRYSYAPDSNAFYADANGKYFSANNLYQTQDEYDDFDAYMDLPNIIVSSMSEEVNQRAIQALILFAVSQLKAEVEWTSDSNYTMNGDKRYMLCGSDEETARLDDGTNRDVYYTGSKQTEVKRTDIDQRNARSFKVRINARLTDKATPTPNTYYDDFAVLHVTLKVEPGFYIEGASDNE